MHCLCWTSVNCCHSISYSSLTSCDCGQWNSNSNSLFERELFLQFWMFLKCNIQWREKTKNTGIGNETPYLSFVHSCSQVLMTHSLLLNAFYITLIVWWWRTSNHSCNPFPSTLAFGQSCAVAVNKSDMSFSIGTEHWNPSCDSTYILYFSMYELI